MFYILAPGMLITLIRKTQTQQGSTYLTIRLMNTTKWAKMEVKQPLATCLCRCWLAGHHHSFWLKNRSPDAIPWKKESDVIFLLNAPRCALTQFFTSDISLGPAMPGRRFDLPIISVWRNEEMLPNSNSGTETTDFSKIVIYLPGTVLEYYTDFY